MSARVIVTTVIVVGAVLGAGAVAMLALSDPPSPVDDAGTAPGTLRPDRPVDDRPGPLREDPDLAPAPEPGSPWISVAGYEDELRAIGWDEVGETYAELVPLLEAHARAVTRGAELPAEQTARIADLWANLDALSEPLKERVEYLFGNGLFAHPAYLVNSVAVTLHERGRGLTRDQLGELERIARETAGDEGFLTELHHQDHMNAILRAMIECEARRALSDSVETVLNERQRGLLHPEPLFGRVGLDPFHAVETLRGHATLVVYDDDTTAGEALVDRIAREIPVDDVTRAAAMGLAEPLAESIVGGLFPEGVRLLDVAGHIDIEQAIIACQRSGEILPMIGQLLAGGELPLIPPDVLERPIILVRAPQD